MHTKAAVFIDKDGTLIDDVPYNVDPSAVRFAAGVEETLGRLNSAGFELFIITNQAGVAMGRVKETELPVLQDFFATAFEGMGCRLAGFYYCPHHPEAADEEYRVACDCRKPAPGMLRRAATEHHLSLPDSWFIGDILNDVEAGRLAGCRTVLINNGNETEWVMTPQRQPHFTVPDFRSAVDVVLKSLGKERAR
ncbi:MAG: hydrolase, HAD-superfamily, subfamily [Verrucomicrobiaceae bacterium]|nr:hydrolase, HAD-superfamily, subfamily [Verrucomicrobiaceae bacterium]